MPTAADLNAYSTAWASWVMAVGGLVAAIAALFMLGLVVRQLWGLRRDLEISAVWSEAAHWCEILKHASRNPALFGMLYSRFGGLAAEDIEAYLLVDMVLTHLNAALETEDSFPPDERPAIREWARDLMQNAPILLEGMKRAPQAWSPRLLEIAAEVRNCPRPGT